MRLAVAISFSALLGGSACGSKSGPAPVAPANPASADASPGAAAPVAAENPADAAAAPSGGDTTSPGAAPAEADTSAPPADAGAAADPAAGDAVVAVTEVAGEPAAPVEPDDGEKQVVEAWRLEKPAEVPPLEKTTGTCIAGIDVDWGNSFFAPALDGRKLELCLFEPAAEDGKMAASCWALDLDTRVIDKLKKAPSRLAALLAPEPEPKASANSKVGKDRKTVEARIGPSDDPKAPFKRLETGGLLVDAVVENAEFYAVSPFFDGSAETEGKRVIVFSRATGEKVSELSLDALGSPCPVVSFAGAMLYVEAGVCAGPGAMGYFLDPKTGAIAHRLGGLENSAAAFGVAPVKLDNGDYAFREQYGLGIFVHDGKTGAHKKTVNLSSTIKKSEDGNVYGAPEGGAMLALGSPIESLVLLQLGRIAIVDPKTWTVTRLIELEACPTDPAP